ncbi:hypothetical protein KCU65_g142, partial [Aureobasidium melanogenum]
MIRLLASYTRPLLPSVPGIKVKSSSLLSKYLFSCISKPAFQSERDPNELGHYATKSTQYIPTQHQIELQNPAPYRSPIFIRLLRSKHDFLYKNRLLRCKQTHHLTCNTKEVQGLQLVPSGVGGGHGGSEMSTTLGIGRSSTCTACIFRRESIAEDAIVELDWLGSWKDDFIVPGGDGSLCYDASRGRQSEEKICASVQFLTSCQVSSIVFDRLVKNHVNKKVAPWSRCGLRLCLEEVLEDVLLVELQFEQLAISGRSRDVFLTIVLDVTLALASSGRVHLGKEFSRPASTMSTFFLP